MARRVIRCAAKLGRYWKHSGHCSALAHIANSDIFPAQGLKQGTKCQISTTSGHSNRTRECQLLGVKRT
jgi:hypothetical protein